MHNPNPRYLTKYLVCWMALLISLATLTPAVANNDELPKEIRDALIAAADQLEVFHCELVVRYDYRVKNLPRVSTIKQSYYFEHGKFENESKVKYPNGAASQTILYAFDGDVLYNGCKSGEGHPILRKMLGVNEDDKVAASTRIEFELGEAIGIGLPKYVSDWIDARVHSEVLALVDSAHRVTYRDKDGLVELELVIPEPACADIQRQDLDKLHEELEGTPPKEIEATMARYRWLRTNDLERRVLMTLDPSKNYALVHRVDYAFNRKKVLEVACSDFEVVAGSEKLFLPKKCTVSHFVKSRSELDGFVDVPDRLHYQVESWSLEARDDAAFNVVYGPGALVADRSTAAAAASPDGEVVYIIPAGSDTLREAAKGVRSRRLWFLVGSVALLAVVGFGFFLKNQWGGNRGT